MIIQFLLTLIAIAGFALVWRRASQGVLSRIESLSWSVLWIAGVIVVWLPEVASRLARLVGVGRGVDCRAGVVVWVDRPEQGVVGRERDWARCRWSVEHREPLAVGRVFPAEGPPQGSNG